MNKEVLIWQEETKVLARQLHAKLSIGDKSWHKDKGNSTRRAAELISAALVQLVSEGKKEDIDLLLQQSILWINDEIKDPGCPKH